ncbi:MAG: PfkB family carbohydrate kinase [Nitrososphaerales archaeon]
MNVLVAGFMTIDRIELPVRTISSVGGPPSYAGLLCARFGLDVTALTKIGTDFPDEQVVWLSRNGLHLKAVDRSTTKKTTRFKLVVTGDERVLYLLERCEDMGVEQVTDAHYNAALISPLAGEITPAVFDEVRRRSDFCFLDPQGYVRSFDASGKVGISPWYDERVMGSIDALKMDMAECQAITGKTSPAEAFERLSARNIRKAVITSGGNPAMILDGTRIMRVEVPRVKVVDSTGAGDVFAGALLTCFLRSRDFLWSCCFGIAASSLSLSAIALGKVDLPRSVDQVARRLYASAETVATA